jgi:hypothetical protein
MPVKLEPGRVYWVGVNSVNHHFFQTDAKVAAQPHVILFATRGTDGKPTPIPEDLAAQAKAINGVRVELFPGVERRYVGRIVATFPNEHDFSMPEAVSAACNRAPNMQAWADLSWVKFDVAREQANSDRQKARDPEGHKVYEEATRNGEIIEVLTYKEDLAATITYLPFPPGKGRMPYSERSFGCIDGKWKNLGEDRCGSVQEARENFNEKKDNIYNQFRELREAAAAPTNAVPLVVSSVPLAFANDVEPTLDEMTVTFDQTMVDGSWSWTMLNQDTFPAPVWNPAYDATRTICRVSVKLEPGRVYWVGINSAKEQSFKTAAGIPAQPHVILFATRRADGKSTPIPDDLAAQARAVNSVQAELFPGIERRYVGRVVATFPNEPEFSIPEAACAACNRASDMQAWADLSWVRFDVAREQADHDRQKVRDPEGFRIYEEATHNGEIIEVLTYKENLAATITYLPFHEGKGRMPYSRRSFGCIDGKWKNLGEDRCASVQDARETFNRHKDNIFAQFEQIKNAAAR